METAQASGDSRDRGTEGQVARLRALLSQSQMPALVSSEMVEGTAHWAVVPRTSKPGPDVDIDISRLNNHTAQTRLWWRADHRRLSTLSLASSATSESDRSTRDQHLTLESSPLLRPSTVIKVLECTAGLVSRLRLPPPPEKKAQATGVLSCPAFLVSVRAAGATGQSDDR